MPDTELVTLSKAACPAPVEPRRCPRHSPAGRAPALRGPSGPTGPATPLRVPGARVWSALIGCRPVGRGRAPLRGRRGAPRGARRCCRTGPMHCTRYGRAAPPRPPALPPLLLPSAFPACSASQPPPVCGNASGAPRRGGAVPGRNRDTAARLLQPPG